MALLTNSSYSSGPTILALDFDGVLCDGLIEYFQSAWQAYCHIWAPADRKPPNGLADRFYRTRPAIETGWEMPVLIQALLLNFPEAKILQDWPAIAQQIILEANLQAATIATTLDQLRDEWIASDLEGWLSQHRFYPGVIERLQQLTDSSVSTVIVTTKEGRFVRQLLQQQGVHLADQQIFGKEFQRPKSQLLRELLQAHNLTAADGSQLWFVEDRLKTLQAVQKQPDLIGVKLFLAEWGYNIASDRELAQHDPGIQLLSLSHFTQDFSTWLGEN